MRLLIVAAVDAEARAIGDADNARTIVSGIGRTNAAAATTEALLQAHGVSQGFDAVLSAGVAGALPQSESSLQIGDCIVASSCIYAEEGLVTTSGFAGMDSLGFKLGDFVGNMVPVDESMLERLSADFSIGPIATVATCSGTDAAAAEIARRTGALAEAMEGAAVVHAARRLHVPAIELRVISNTTGDRAMQQWDLPLALRSLSAAAQRVVALLNA